MNTTKIFKNPGFLSTLTILLLLSSYLFTVIYNQMSIEAKSSTIANFLLSFTLVILIFFLIVFIFFFISMFHISEMRELFAEPGNIGIITSTILVCSYLSTIMNGYISKIYGGLSVLSQIFFYLSITFFVFFLFLFIALLVSFSNKFLYSR